MPAEALPAPFDRIRLGISGKTPLVGYGGEEDPGAMDWHGEASITVYPDEEDDEPGGAWWEREGAALDKAAADEGLKVPKKQRPPQRKKCTPDDDGAGPQAGRGQGLSRGDRLITSGAHHLRMSKKDPVEAAVEFYLNARRGELQAGMRELLSQLDGSRAARAALLVGAPVVDPDPPRQ